jgi:hypothetical protein
MPLRIDLSHTLFSRLRTSPVRLIRFVPFLAVITLALSACGGGDADPGSGGLATGEYARLELEASYPEPLSFLSGVRELSDGSIMAADPLSEVVLRLDLQTGTADTLGRVGEGPGEYKQPDQVFALPGDSTLLMDIGKTELAVVDPEGVIHSGMKMASMTDEGSFNIIVPRFVDGQGRLYFTAAGGMREGPPDSTKVARYDRGTEETETMGWIWRPEPIVTRVGNSTMTSSVQMAGRDDWAVGPDGSFAIVRANGYQVEWHFPDGRVVTGPPNQVETPNITDEDKEAYLEQRSGSGLMMTVSSSSDGQSEMGMSRGGGGMRMPESNLTDFEWAEEYAPFRFNRSAVAPTGELWVERWLPADQAPTFDVFGRDGVKIGSVELPQGRQLLGWGTTADGETAVYLVQTDEFDLKYLERYRVVR